MFILPQDKCNDLFLACQSVKMERREMSSSDEEEMEFRTSLRPPGVIASTELLTAAASRVPSTVPSRRISVEERVNPW